MPLAVSSELTGFGTHIVKDEYKRQIVMLEANGLILWDAIHLSFWNDKIKEK